MNNYLLEVKNLHVSFFTDRGEVKAVRGISLSLEQGKTLGLVGESGSGKTVTALSIMQLLPNSAKITAGSILYKGKELLGLAQEKLRKIRGREISMIFQEPMTALNPVFTIGEQIREAVELHRNLKRREATYEVIKLLEDVGISEPNKRIKDYPHQLSGGMRQRVLIAMALASPPSILIADEPTTALDVTIQVQIIELIKKLQKELGIAMLLITHDLGIIAETADDVAVMYAGKIVEYASCKVLLNKPLHPYTCGLLDSIPQIEGSVKKPLKPISGSIPNLIYPAQGCSFSQRCPKAFVECFMAEPQLAEVEKGHWAACIRYER